MEHGPCQPMESALQGLNPYYNGRYSWRLWNLMNRKLLIGVLILIIMEDTHGAPIATKVGELINVLILIIMEDTHGAWPLSTNGKCSSRS